MTLKSHIIAGVIGTAALYPILGGWKSAIFFLSSFLIDADHYLEYLYRVKKTTGKFPDWRPKSMFKYYDEVTKNRFDKRNLGFSLLHTAEAFAVIYLMAVFINYDFFITILGGMAYHYIFDVISLSWEHLHFIRSYSLVEHFIRIKKMKNSGFDPDEFYKDMHAYAFSKNTKNTER